MIRLVVRLSGTSYFITVYPLSFVGKRWITEVKLFYEQKRLFTKLLAVVINLFNNDNNYYLRVTIRLWFKCCSFQIVRTVWRNVVWCQIIRMAHTYVQKVYYLQIFVQWAVKMHFIDFLLEIFDYLTRFKITWLDMCLVKDVSICLSDETGKILSLTHNCG